MTAFAQYNPIDTPDDVVLEACPVCGWEAIIERYSTAPDSKTNVVVCCSNCQPFGPQNEAMLTVGCLLYLPPEEFYHGTIRGAVEYWNEYSVAVKALRKENGA